MSESNRLFVRETKISTPQNQQVLSVIKGTDRTVWGREEMSLRVKHYASHRHSDHMADAAWGGKRWHQHKQETLSSVQCIHLMTSHLILCCCVGDKWWWWTAHRCPVAVIQPRFCSASMNQQQWLISPVCCGYHVLVSVHLQAVIHKSVTVSHYPHNNQVKEEAPPPHPPQTYGAMGKHQCVSVDKRWGHVSLLVTPLSGLRLDSIKQLNI